MSSQTWSRFQAGHMLRGLLALGALIIIAVGLTQDEVGFGQLNLPLVVLFAVGLLFHGLKVEVDDAAVRLAFGVGLIRRTFPIDQILSSRPVKVAWWHGWGVRLVRSQGRWGWLWNVSGWDAVELNLADGRFFWIGTDDPQGLQQAIKVRLTTRHT